MSSLLKCIVLLNAIDRHESDIINGMKKSQLLACNWINESCVDHEPRRMHLPKHMISSILKRSDDVLNIPYSHPTHDSSRILLSMTNVKIQHNPALNEFDLLLELYCFDSRTRNVTIVIPLKRNEHFNKWKSKGKLCSSVILTDKYIQFSFECEQGKKTEGDIL